MFVKMYKNKKWVIIAHFTLFENGVQRNRGDFVFLIIFCFTFSADLYLFL
jgi:hypothetical protein